MNYLDLLRSRYQQVPGAGADLRFARIDPVVEQLYIWQRRLQLPTLSERERERLGAVLPDSFRQVLLYAVDLLSRRPQLARRVGITSAQLDSLRRKELEMAMVVQLAQRILQAARDGQLLLTGRLARKNARAAAGLGRAISDPALPLTERHRLVALTEGVRLWEGRRQQRRARTTARRQDRQREARAEVTATRERLETQELTQTLREALHLRPTLVMDERKDR